MKPGIHLSLTCALLAVLFWSPALFAYQNSGQFALTWLEAQQSADGSWGSADGNKAHYTGEAVAAFRSFHRINGAYFGGVTWMENHDFPNLDAKGRKIVSLLHHGDAVQSLIAQVTSDRRHSSSGSQGWGLSGFYQMSPLDTALVLESLRDTGWSDYASALTYLCSGQNADGGWSLGLDASSNPLTTAIVTRILCRYQALDPQIDVALIAAENYLSGQVGTGANALLRAETVLALLPNGRQASKANQLLASLQIDQQASGAWEDDPYATSRVVQAFAAAAGKNPEEANQDADIPDAGLRSAINDSLGKNANDALSQGEMAEITSLYAVGKGITDLAGLALAHNLTYLDLRNNNITDLSPLLALDNLETVLLDGNPLSDVEDTDGDGFSDLAEVQAGTNPLDPASFPSDPDPPPAVPALNLVGMFAVLSALAGMGMMRKKCR